jgi:hypothetical protein
VASGSADGGNCCRVRALELLDAAVVVDIEASGGRAPAAGSAGVAKERRSGGGSQRSRSRGAVW